jgi:hypothetical protein
MADKTNCIKLRLTKHGRERLCERLGIDDTSIIEVLNKKLKHGFILEENAFNSKYIYFAESGVEIIISTSEEDIFDVITVKYSLNRLPNHRNIPKSSYTNVEWRMRDEI